jgi:protein associated with RNAse G/E
MTFSAENNQTIKRLPSDEAQPKPGALVTVRATKFDGRDHWVHPATLLQADQGLVMTRTSAGLAISRGDGRTFTSPYNTRAHYWPDRWFNVIRLELPGQGLYGFYCNIASPVQFDGATVGYVDLQLDVIARATSSGDLTYWLADEDEFEEARDHFGYDDALITRCYEAVDQVSKLIERRQFPFDR